MCEVQLPDTEMRTVKTAVYYADATAEDVPAAESSFDESGQSWVRSNLGIEDCGRKSGMRQYQLICNLKLYRARLKRGP